jgi:phospholipase C
LNPLPGFDTVKQDGQLKNIQDLANYFKAAKDGILPAVSWITPNDADSEHPPSSVSGGSGSRHPADQRGDAGTGVGQHRHLPGLG